VSDTQEAGGNETTRVEAFSDAVFAIAITLLALELKVPHLEGDDSNAALFAALLKSWPSYVAFLNVIVQAGAWDSRLGAASPHRAAPQVSTR